MQHANKHESVLHCHALWRGALEPEGVGEADGQARDVALVLHYVGENPFSR